MGRMKTDGEREAARANWKAALRDARSRWRQEGPQVLHARLTEGGRVRELSLRPRGRARQT